MAKRKYTTREHQAARKQLGQLVALGEAYCVEPICLMPTRWIPPGTSWDVCHDTTGTIITGPGHPKCNRTEGAVRGNKLRGRTGAKRRWVL